MKTPRERALAHIKTLAAASMVVGGCGGGYGVVDPMPNPYCFEYPKPEVTAKVLETKDDGTRLVEIVAKFQQTDAKFGELEAYRMVAAFQGGDNKLTITEQTINANDLRVVIAVPKGTMEILLHVNVTCTQGRNFDVYMDIDDAGTLKVTSVR